jgi:putative oxidoreductase
MDNKIAYAQLYLRIALGVTFLLLGLDRLGCWGPYGSPYVSWGDWSHFSAYAHQVMSFLPGKLVDVFAIFATIGEIGFGFLILIGWFTRLAAIGSGVLTLCFSISMAVSFGITSPFNYSVFTVSAASFLLSVIPAYKWSIDALRSSAKK